MSIQRNVADPSRPDGGINSNTLPGVFYYLCLSFAGAALRVVSLSLRNADESAVRSAVWKFRRSFFRPFSSQKKDRRMEFSVRLSREKSLVPPWDYCILSHRFVVCHRDLSLSHYAV